MALRAHEQKWELNQSFATKRKVVHSFSNPHEY